MGSGLVAFAGRSEAEGFAAERGAVVVSWDDVNAKPAPPVD